MNTVLRTELDALELLMQDHREIEGLFRDFEHLRQTGSDTSAVVEAACAELRMHDTGKNAVFYPALEGAVSGDLRTLLDEAEAAHDAILDRIEGLDTTDADAAQRNAQFGALVEQVKAHMLREENEVFPRVRQLGNVDLCAVARDLMKQRTAVA